MDLVAVEKALWLVHFVLLTAVVVRLFTNGLLLRYRAFACLATVLAIRNVVLYLVSGKAVVFFWTWLTTEPVVVLLYVLSVFELYSLALQRYEGIRTYSRRLLLLAMIIASLVSVVSIFPDLEFNAFPESQWYLLVNVIRRGVYTSLLGFLVLLVSFISVFPIKLSRNTILHVVVFSAWFLFHTGSILVMNFGGPDIIPVVNLIAVIAAVLTAVVWGLFLSPVGEGVQSAVRSKMSKEQAALLLDKLNSINESLANSQRRL